jgi:putative nucleotidyltransferase with HDIG domain
MPERRTRLFPNSDWQFSIWRESDYLNIFNEEKAVSKLVEVIALEYGASSAEAGAIRTAAALHDIGKHKIPKAILNKPGKLTEAEFEIIKTHTSLGVEILENFQGELGEMARVIALYHHERYDGCGYWRKPTEELPFYVSITAIADVFAALVCTRPYKKPWPPDDALDYIGRQAGAQFDPVLAGVFIALVRNDGCVRAIFAGR